MKKYGIVFILIFITNLWGKDFDIREFGAVPNEMSTTAVQKAIDQCSKIGGRVIFPTGEWTTGTVYLKDNVTIYLSKNAVWRGSKSSNDYPFIQPVVQSREDKGPRRALIYAHQQNNISITGEGTIAPGGDYDIFHADKNNTKYYFRPYGLFIIECRDVEVSGIKMRNSAFWMQRYLNCDDVRIHDIDIWNHCNLNNDGIDIDGCHNVIISDCKIDA